MIARMLLALALCVGATSCATTGSSPPAEAPQVAKPKPRSSPPRKKKKPPPRPSTEAQEQSAPSAKGELAGEGVISWYSDSLAGRLTASGERYRPKLATCAHRTLPFGTRVRVVLPQSGAEAECRVNDRGPFVDGRVLDVSRSVAERLHLIDAGLAEGRIFLVDDDRAAEGE